MSAGHHDHQEAPAVESVASPALSDISFLATFAFVLTMLASIFDSIYGSRHLASFWQHNPDPATAAALRGAVDHKPELERVDLMVLLDLIGASNNEFVPLQQPTAGLFKQLGTLESRLHDAKFISKTYMNTRAPAGAGYIDDDHRPFVERNVPVMHLISVPFPKVWHTLHDDGKALDPVVIEDMSLILRSFVASYLRLSV
ncbi:hypothetical protein GQ54DRAFT_312671 [Martensiomyces pterosporus]|nr:hypothetical protein GQ54DRAFT_312671 [Martensiomyces pterosporus]